MTSSEMTSSEMTSSEMTLVDALNDYLKKPNRDNYNCREGFLRFYITDNDFKNDICIHCIVLKEEYRRKGIFTAFIRHIIDNTNYERVLILGMGSEEIVSFIKKFRYHDIGFVDHGGDAIWARDKDYCKCHIWSDDGRILSKKSKPIV